MEDLESKALMVEGSVTGGFSPDSYIRHSLPEPRHVTRNPPLTMDQREHPLAGAPFLDSLRKHLTTKHLPSSLTPHAEPTPLLPIQQPGTIVIPCLTSLGPQ